MNSSGENQLEMDVDAPTGNPSVARSVRSTPSLRGNNVLLRRSPPRTISENLNRQRGTQGQHPSIQQLREEDIANRGARANQQPAQDNNPQPVQANNPPAAQVKNSRVTPIDLTLRERFQELERENKRLKVALEKRKELEEEAIPHFESNRSNRHSHRERYDPRKGDEVLDGRRLSQSDARRSEDVRNVYQSRDHHDDDYYDRYVPDDDHYYTAEQDRRTRSSHKKHRQRDDHINDDHSKRSRRDKDLSKRRKESDRNERIRRETEGDSVRGEEISKRMLSEMIGELLAQKQSKDEEQQILSMKKSMDSPFVEKIRRYRPPSNFNHPQFKEFFDGRNGNPVEHVQRCQASMSLWSFSDELLYRTFSMTLTESLTKVFLILVGGFVRKLMKLERWTRDS
ncbi:putative mediator of RNA polymerase II transcription subunit 26 [Papaver somniferum]|uniref:putative mediator of RNA polymerase II transcription subunit 26 n=1 Tax=Papaver somniferum TaxID=3469 RepID=UPI000E6FBFA2|nr:putative mediator of RNA polymerase II transcription subunit 26 [Papaver somniferum]XP_026383375.1 putative mediator of RNA polymerase II transcription subunit 26 [Papaver somniferum]XP_026383379.1 putative mediator of RNA polymerase II transcription subunit 26 [Papaver somniferum]